MDGQTHRQKVLTPHTAVCISHGENEQQGD